MSTRMACEPALMEQERWVTEMLSSHPRLELSGPYLALHWGEGEQWWLGLEQRGHGDRADTDARIAGSDLVVRRGRSGCLRATTRAAVKSASLVSGAMLARCRSARG